MLRRSLLVSALMLAGVVGFASSAKAAPVNQVLEFTTNVAATCDLNTPVAGTLAVNGAKTAFNTNTTAKIDINCTAGVLSIGDPIPDGTNPTATTTNMASITTLGTQTAKSTSSVGGATTVTLGGGDVGTANVSMDASIGTGTLTAGAYKYTVTVTATP